MKEVIEEMDIRVGAYSGAKYLVINGKWYPLDGEYWKKGTVFDYDPDLGTYVNGVLGYSINDFDMDVDTYLLDTYNNGMPMSLNEAAQDVCNMLEAVLYHNEKAELDADEELTVMLDEYVRGE